MFESSRKPVSNFLYLLAQNASIFEEEFEIYSRSLVDHVIDPNQDLALLDRVSLQSVQTSLISELVILWECFKSAGH